MSRNQESLTIGERFRGPPRSGNGGYVGGSFAQLLNLPPSKPVEVTLRAPVPLDTPLDVDRESEDHVRVLAGDTVIAEVWPVGFHVAVPEPPDWDSALEARPNAISLQHREGPVNTLGRGMHPICFCCGADHEDGLEIFAAPVDDHQVAAAWSTKEAWGDEDGNLPVPYLWTALDCPGQIAFAVQGVRTGLLGRITAVVERPAKAGDDYIVTAWPVEIDGKKHFAGSAVHTTDGVLIAKALSIWIGRRN